MFRERPSDTQHTRRNIRNKLINRVDFRRWEKKQFPNNIINYLFKKWQWMNDIIKSDSHGDVYCVEADVSFQAYTIHTLILWAPPNRFTWYARLIRTRDAECLRNRVRKVVASTADILISLSVSLSNTNDFFYASSKRQIYGIFEIINHLFPTSTRMFWCFVWCGYWNDRKYLFACSTLYYRLIHAACVWWLYTCEQTEINAVVVYPNLFDLHSWIWMYFFTHSPCILQPFSLKVKLKNSDA